MASMTDDGTDPGRPRSSADALADELRAAEEELRAAGVELSEELRAAGIVIGAGGIELGDELRGAASETRRAIRRALVEVRRAVRGSTARTAGSPPAGRRMSRAERKELTRELLLDAAGEVFATKGYHGASLEDVAETAGFTKGAVYSNFATKSELFIALAERRLQERKDALLEAIASMSADELPSLARAAVDRTGEDEGRMDLLMLEFTLAAIRDRELRAVFSHWQRDISDAVGSAIEAKLRASGIEPAFDGRELMLMLDGIGTRLMLDALIEPSTDAGDLMERAARHLAMPTDGS